MKNAYVPKLTMHKTNNPFAVGGSGMAQGSITRNTFSNGDKSFKDVMSDTLGNLNDTITKPDAMMMETMTNGTYDVHDVMLASAKAELAVTITAQMTTKVVQAYDRILQIQV